MIKTFLMNSQLLRQKFLDFFKEKGHTIIPSASLIPENDPTVLFTTAGMHPLVPYLLGEPHPAGKRVVDIQKCIRTGDIDEVGDNRHLTFFEMLGNWSLGDYFKKEAIEWSFEFLTSPKWLGLDPSRLYVTVFAGNHESPLDEVSIKYWQEQFKKFDINAQVSLCGVWENASTHIFALPREDNWWGLESGGPCGPCTEMFYDVAPEQGFQKGKTHQELVNNFRFFEIWNDVFMEYKRLPNGHLEKLVQKNVDTGMGLERTLAILNGRTNVFESESFQNIFELLTLESEKTYTSSEACGRAMRIIADHLRASVMIINDGVIPSNKDQGYVLRRLIRRAVRYGKCLGIKSLFLAKISKGIIEDFQKHYKELQKNTQHIYDILTQEEQKFNRTIEKGLHEFEKMYEKNSGISGEDAFILYSTYGFPLELTEEISLQKGQKINRELFEEEFNKHQKRSRVGASQKFVGGLSDHSQKTVYLHTATHLLQQALRIVLGTEIYQKGSNITHERLRFDFPYHEKLTDSQKQQIEDIVNEVIQKDLPIYFEMLTLEQAKEKGALGVFEEKYKDYGEKIKVYMVGREDQLFSQEICGGPHAPQTGFLGTFKIQKEESVGSGIRRIKAILLNSKYS